MLSTRNAIYSFGKNTLPLTAFKRLNIDTHLFLACWCWGRFRQRYHLLEKHADIQQFNAIDADEGNY